MSQLSSVAVNEVPDYLPALAPSVHKFGGSSLATTDCIKRVANIIKNNAGDRDIIVVSANGDITDKLIALAGLAGVKEQLIELADIHQALLRLHRSVFADQVPNVLTEALREDISLLESWITRQNLSPDSPLSYYANLLAFGEVWSARLLASYLSANGRQAAMLDAREFLVVNDPTECTIDYCRSKQRLQVLLGTEKLTVVTGFIALSSQGDTVLLGRNGSDYSATIIANLVNGAKATIWTDVCGIYSADPRLVKSAQKFSQLPHAVALELGRLGNPVLHEKTLKPILKGSTGLTIASSFTPEQPGTEVVETGSGKRAVSVTFLNQLVHISSPAYNQVSAATLDNALQPLLCDKFQHTLVIKAEHLAQAKTLLADQPFPAVYTPVSMLAAVGESIARDETVAAQLLTAVTPERVFAVYPTKNEHSNAVLINGQIEANIVNSAHNLIVEQPKATGVVIAGLGNIGKCFVEMLARQVTSRPELSSLSVVGALSSRFAWFETQGMAITQIISKFEANAKPYNSEQLMHWLTEAKASGQFAELVVIDITPSQAFARLYADFFTLGVHVVGANKCAGSDSLRSYQQLKSLSAEHQAHWLASTTVGAGLPVNGAIDELYSAGDTLQEISGIFSGTLSWLFQNFDGSESFSSLVLKARTQGLTEPDPRDDLSGLDVQRKLLILAREAGYELELGDIVVENLVPESLRDLPLAEFLPRVDELDQMFAKRLEHAQKHQQVLRYLAQFTFNGESWQAKVGLQALPEASAFANLTPCDNVFMLKSHWYQENPLIIRGPGAGREVTAGGLHTDLIKLFRLLGQRTRQRVLS